MANKTDIPTNKRGDVVIYLRMDKTLATEMKAIAKRQSRTIAGQIAFALWQWLDGQDEFKMKVALARREP